MRDQLPQIGPDRDLAVRQCLDITVEPPPAGLHGQPHLRLIDFGSAVDAHSMAQLYGSDGPSADQQTRDYAPPEATFGSFWHGSRHVRTQPCSVESCSRSVLLPPVPQ